VIVVGRNTHECTSKLNLG